jgi:hypothetical protein
MRQYYLVGFFVVHSIFVTPAVAKDESEVETASRDQQRTVIVAKESRVRIGGISLVGGYSRFSGPLYWGAPYYGYYASPYWTPFWQTYFPYSGPLQAFYPAYSFQRRPNMGEIKLHAEPRTASVFINDAYAGTAEDLKSIWLEPGAYDLKIEAADGSSFSRRLYVLSGKTLKVDAQLSVPKGAQP